MSCTKASKAVLFRTVEEEDEAISNVADDIEQQSRDFVLKQIHQKLKGHGLAEFVEHLLKLMGYKTRLSKRGPDRGIDIMAHKDDLGVTPPAVIVQVKSGERMQSTSNARCGVVISRTAASRNDRAA